MTDAARIAGKNGFSLISDETFRELYAALLQCRILDERLLASAGYERWAGSEAGTAGLIACLRSGDSVTPTRRGLLAAYLQKASLPMPRETVQEPLAQLAAATSDGLRHKLGRLGNITVVFTYAGEPDRMHEVFATAASNSLPVLYVLECGEPLADVCGGIPVIRVDAADTVAIYRVAHESTRRAREGGGPTIIECAAWHGDDDLQDPLAKLERYLAGKRIFRQDWKQRLEKKLRNSLTAL